MKKFFSVVLAALMLSACALGFTACKKDAADESKEETKTVESGAADESADESAAPESADAE